MTQVQLFSGGPKEPSPLQEVAQHNHLIFAPFAMASMESRIFISMLERINRSDESFPEWKIPFKDIMLHRNGYYFEEFKKAARNIVSYVVDIAPTDGKQRKTMPRTIVRKCDYEEGRGFIICQFHEDMKEYLLKLIGNFTRADLAVLKNFNDEKSVRFYWMLKSRFYKGDKVVITVEECRKCLLPQGATSYPFPNDFRKHILEKTIQKDLLSTDCAFDIGSPIKSGKTTIAWHFLRRSGGCTVVKSQPVALSVELTALLEACGIDKQGIGKIADLLGQVIGGVEVDEKFIRYVVMARKEEKHKKGDKVFNLGGYIVKTIREGWYCQQYLAGKVNPQGGPRYRPPVSVKREQATSYVSLSMGEAQAMYEKEKAAGKTRYPLPGFIKALKTGRNIVVEGFNY